MTRTGYVAQAAVDVLAARLSCEVPGLTQREIYRIARTQADDLGDAGWRVTAPVTAVAAGARRRSSRT